MALTGQDTSEILLWESPALEMLHSQKKKISESRDLLSEVIERREGTRVASIRKGECVTTSVF